MAKELLRKIVCLNAFAFLLVLLTFTTAQDDVFDETDLVSENETIENDDTNDDEWDDTNTEGDLTNYDISEMKGASISESSKSESHTPTTNLTTRMYSTTVNWTYKEENGRDTTDQTTTISLTNFTQQTTANVILTTDNFTSLNNISSYMNNSASTETLSPMAILMHNISSNVSEMHQGNSTSMNSSANADSSLCVGFFASFFVSGCQRCQSKNDCPKNNDCCHLLYYPILKCCGKQLNFRIGG